MKPSIRWIGRVVGRRWWMIAVLCVIQSVSAAMSVVFALVMRQAVDAAVAGNTSGFAEAVLAIAAMVLCLIVLGLVGGFHSARTGAVIDNRFREVVLAGILALPVAKANRYHSGELLNRLTSDVNVVVGGALGMLPGLLSLVIRFVGAVAVMLMLMPQLTMAFLAAAAVMVLASLPVRSWLKRMHRQVQEAQGVMRSFLQECLENLLVIRIFNAQRRMLGVNRGNMNDLKRLQVHRANVSNMIGSGLSLALQCGFFIGFIWCGHGLLQGTLSYGTMVAMMQLIGQLQGPVVSVGGILPRLATITASAERLMELLPDGGDPDAVPDDVLADGPSDPTGNAQARRIYQDMGMLEFDHVTFGYDEQQPVLDNFNAAIRRGECVAVMGPSGIGKSTLLKLLLGVCEPQSGSVRVVMDDGEKLDAKDMARFFAFVPQGNVLMSGTIREAVAFASDRDDVDDRRVAWACHAACADTFISQLPDGYDTVLGERGAGLSEGQLQRISVARALYADAPVLLLDEATSALDGTTETMLLESLRALPDHTVILVTHRLETVPHCDRVIRMPLNARMNARMDEERNSEE